MADDTMADATALDATGAWQLGFVPPDDLSVDKLLEALALMSSNRISHTRVRGCTPMCDLTKG